MAPAPTRLFSRQGKNDGVKLLCAVILSILCCMTARADSTNTNTAPAPSVVSGAVVSSAQGETWTIDGETYHDVHVNRVELDSVSIMYDAGVTHLDWKDLPPDVQKELANKHDPLVAAVKAQQDADAVAATAKAQAEDEERQQQEALVKKEETLEKKAKSDFDSSDKATVNGQVFIVTKGAENYKLGSIHVYLYSEEEVLAIAAVSLAKAIKLKPALDAERENCNKMTQQYAAVLQRYQGMSPVASELIAAQKASSDSLKEFRTALAKYYSNFSSEYYSQTLPTPLADAQTDADGKFSMQIPKTGSWVLEAEGERSVGDTKEGYVWLARASSDAIAKSQIFLTNENLSTSSSPDSVAVSLSQSDIEEIIATADHLVSKDAKW